MKRQNFADATDGTRIRRLTVLNRAYHEVSVRGRTHVRKSPKAAGALARVLASACADEAAAKDREAEK